MPQGRIRTTDSPTGRLRTTDSPIGNIGYSGILTQGAFIKGGTPIGLLLALTYATDFNVTNIFFGERPVGNIRNTD